MENQLMVLEVVPQIKNNIIQVKDEIEEKVNYVRALSITEENLQEAKKLRAKLNEYFEDFEKQRKELKKKIEQPYNDVMEVYNPYIKDTIKEGLDILKDVITEIEDLQKERIKEEISEYFNEKKVFLNLPEWITFERYGVQIKKSTSITKYKKEIDQYLETVSSDIATIDLQEYPEEVYEEYKQGLTVNQAIIKVKARHQSMEENRKARQVMSDIDKQLDEQEKAVEQAVVTKVEEATEDKTVDCTFTVTCTIEQLKELKAYMVEKGIKIHGNED